MIGVFAKMFSEKDRVTEVAPLQGSAAGYEVGAREEGSIERRTQIEDAPPDAFVEKVEYEGGNLYVIPFIEAFKAWARQVREDKRAENEEKKA